MCVCVCVRACVRVCVSLDANVSYVRTCMYTYELIGLSNNKICSHVRVYHEREGEYIIVHVDR